MEDNIQVYKDLKNILPEEYSRLDSTIRSVWEEKTFREKLVYLSEIIPNDIIFILKNIIDDNYINKLFVAYKPTSISNQGVEFLIRLEGSKRFVYLDSANLPTIGIGHLLTKEELTSGKIIINQKPVLYRNGLTENEIRILFINDLSRFVNSVSKSVKVFLTNYQFDSLCSFAFNIGVRAFESSTLVRNLNNNDYTGVPNQMKRWIYSGGLKVAGLANRRAKEANLWTHGRYNQ